MQEALQTAGYKLPRFGANGKFGDETVKALKKFQTDHCPKDAGRLDKQTMEQLSIASTKFPEYDKLFADGKLNTPIAVGYDEDRSDKGQAKDVIAGLTKRGYTQLDPDKAATDKPMAERFKAADSDEDVRYFAADALGDVRTAAVMQAIQTRLTAETSPVVRSALLAAKNKLDRAASR
jgi:peptidoglycan hydrolase-like protein with peptidoglycan-binding domain